MTGPLAGDLATTGAVLSGGSAALAVLAAGWLLRPSSARRRLLVGNDHAAPRLRGGQGGAPSVGDTRRQSQRAGNARRLSPRIGDVRRLSRRAREARANELTELVDVTAVGVAAGLSLHAALRLATASRRNHLAALLDDLLADHRLTTVEALDRFVDHAGSVAVSFAELVASSLHYGIELQGALDGLAAELRNQARRRAEARVRRLPVALLFPLVLCVLPALGLVGVVPVVVAAFDLL